MGKLSDMMAQPLSDGIDDIEPSPVTRALYQEPRFLRFHYFIPLYAALQSPSFALPSLASRSSGSGPFSLTPGLQIPGRRITVSLFLHGTRGIPCATRQNCVPSVQGATCWCTWALSPSPVHCSSQESASWLDQQFCVEGPMSQFSQPLKAFQWGYQCYYESTHSPHGVGPEVWCRGALSGGTQIWTDWFLRFYKERNSPSLSFFFKGVFSSKCRELSFCSLSATEFHTLSLWNGPRISSLNFSCLKIQVGLLK